MQGLGKTIQVIGLVAALLGKTGRRADDIRLALSPYSERKILIAVPTTVLGNWKNEFERWLYFAPNALGLAHGDQVFCFLTQTHSLDLDLACSLTGSLSNSPTHPLFRSLPRGGVSSVRQRHVPPGARRHAGAAHLARPDSQQRGACEPVIKSHQHLPHHEEHTDRLNVRRRLD